MSTAKIIEAKRLFEDAVELPEGEREQFLDEHVAHDAELRSIVMRLLRADDAERADSTAGGEISIGTPACVEALPSKIGPYHIEALAGEGGFGFVYRAEQREPVRRRVALKVLKRGMGSKEVLARFEAERQALALMEHPNVAKIYEAGETESGEPYFAMELVEGEVITKYCDEHRLSTRERIKLFVGVCRAVQHAHSKGVIHRDLKPTNVLVAEIDGHPVPKVIDFGIAKATQQELTTHTLFTSAGHLVGTPEYMSPEQADLRETAIDTRSDVYSLGVLLYELLCGSLPFASEELREKGFLEIVRVIKEDEPPRLSTRIGSADSARIAARRQSDARTLLKELRGDLEWIVARAMEKEPERRYATVNGMAHDLESFLAYEPVLACPPSARDRVFKFVRRNRAAVSAAVLVLAALLVGLGLALWQRGIAIDNEASAKAALEEKKSALKAEQEALLSEKAARADEKKALAAQQKALDAERAARRTADGHRLSAQAIAMLDHDPSLATLLAIEGAKRTPGPQANSSLYRCLERNRLRKVLRGHDRGVRHVAVSSDDRRILSADMTRLVILWDLTSGKLLRRMDVHNGDVSSLTFDPSGRVGMSTSVDGTAWLWSAEDGRELQRLEFGGGVLCAAFAPEGKSICFGLEDGRVVELPFALPADKGAGLADRAVAPVDMARLRELVRHKTPVLALSWSHGRQHMASIDEQEALVYKPGETPRWRFAQRRFRRAAGSGGKDVGERRAFVAFTHGDQELWTTTSACRAARWDLASGEGRDFAEQGRSFCVEMMLGPRGRFAWQKWFPLDGTIADRFDVFIDLVAGKRRVTSCRGWRPTATFSPSGSQVFLAERVEGSIHETRTGRPLFPLQGHLYRIHAAAFTSDGTRLVTGSDDTCVHIWDMNAYPSTRALEEVPQAWAHGSDFSSDGRFLILRGAADWKQHRVRSTLVDLRTGKVLMSSAAAIDSARMDDLGRRAIVNGSDAAEIWDLEKLRVLHRIEGQWRIGAISRCGRLASLMTADKKLAIVDCDTGRIRIKKDCGQGYQRLGFSPDCKQVLLRDNPGHAVRVLDSTSLEEIHVFVDHTGWGTDAQWTPDGSKIITVAADTTAMVYDAKTFQALHRLRGMETGDIYISVDPTSRLAAFWNNDELVLFSLETGKRLADWKATPARQVHGVRFSPDGQALMVFRGRIVEALPLDPLSHAIKTVHRSLRYDEQQRFGIGTEDELRKLSTEPIEWHTCDQGVAAALEQLRRGKVLDAERILDEVQTFRRYMFPVFWYARACVEAMDTSQADRLARAIAALKQAVAMGFSDSKSLKIIESSPFLEPVRKHKGFSRTMKRWKRQYQR